MGTLGIDFEKGLFLGIDFGTTNSVVSVYDYDLDEVLTIPIDEKKLFPTVIMFEQGDDGKLINVFGQEAKESAIIYPESTILSIKRWLGKDQPIKVQVGEDHYDFKAEDVVAKLLAHLKEQAGAYLRMERGIEGEFGGCVITVPANSTDKQKSKMKSAAISAGFLEDHVHLRLEPAAAAIAYAQNATNDANIMVYDFGGGTFDACLLAINKRDDQEPEIRIVSTFGDNYLGGNDLDKCMMDILYGHFIEETGGSIDLFDLTKDDGMSKKAKKMAVLRLYQASNQAKEKLSSVMTTKVVLAPFIQEPRIVNLNIEISREAYYHHKRHYQLDDEDGVFEMMKHQSVKDLVDKTVSCTLKCIESAGISPEAIDQVFLVGGSSGMPLVSETIQHIFNKEPYKGALSPALSISQGAAHYCHMIMMPKSKGPKVHETTIHPLGLEISGRRFLEVISDGMVIPEEGLVVEMTEPIYTNFDDLSSMAIVVFEDTEPGQDIRGLRFVYEKGMKRLASTTLKGIPKAPKGQEGVLISFNLTRDNLLRVHARSVSNDGVSTELNVQDLYE